ncbi:MAG: gliding motility-associated C-terminal domain-containing protein [Bacteroidaceae bacterium]|nr:gliding motility-associated C-terminal domain-containing protein [Bacteroidaceae bacterium]
MNIKTKITLVMGCILLMMACSNDPEESELFNNQTRQNTNRADTVSTDTTKKMVIPAVPDETGAAPYILLYSIDDEDTVVVNPGESQTAQAPVELRLFANIGNPDNYKCHCEWRIWSTKDNGNENSPLVTRFEENTTYTLNKSGGYNAKLYLAFIEGDDTIAYESEPINIVISESKLTCPDGFTPNNDSINDTYRITAQSIVKLDAKFFNRWGEKLHSVNLETAKHVEGEPNKLVLWDGKKGGKVVDNGVYYLYLEALGSDGVKYKIKKAINVLKGFREGTENAGGGGGDS